MKFSAISFLMVAVLLISGCYTPPIQDWYPSSSVFQFQTNQVMTCLILKTRNILGMVQFLHTAVRNISHQFPQKPTCRTSAGSALKRSETGTASYSESLTGIRIIMTILC